MLAGLVVSAPELVFLRESGFGQLFASGATWLMPRWQFELFATILPVGAAALAPLLFPRPWLLRLLGVPR
jgi:hypothetical protein